MLDLIYFKSAVINEVMRTMSHKVEFINNGVEIKKTENMSLKCKTEMTNLLEAFSYRFQ